MNWTKLDDILPNEFGVKYLVNKMGEVKSLKQGRERVLKPDIDKDGYHIYRLTNKEGRRKAFKSHRLVALTFLENPYQYKIVHHKDGVKSNNSLENLEWTTNSQNIQYAFDEGFLKVYNRGIKILDVNNNEIVSYFHGYEELSKITGLTKTTLYDMAVENKMIFEGFKMIRKNKADYSSEKLFNNVFINRKINGRCKPFKWDGKIYDRVDAFVTDQDVPKSFIKKLLRQVNPIYLNKPLQYISQYQYVTHE